MGPPTGGYVTPRGPAPNARVLLTAARFAVSFDYGKRHQIYANWAFPEGADHLHQRRLYVRRSYPSVGRGGDPHSSSGSLLATR
jgi:hypothetical protein